MSPYTPHQDKPHREHCNSDQLPLSAIAELAAASDPRLGRILDLRRRVRRGHFASLLDDVLRTVAHALGDGRHPLRRIQAIRKLSDGLDQLGPCRLECRI